MPTSNQLDYREAKRKCKGEQEVLTCSAAVRMRVITFAHDNPSVVFRAGATNKATTCGAIPSRTLQRWARRKTADTTVLIEADTTRFYHSLFQAFAGTLNA